MPIVHLTARAHERLTPFETRASCAWIWERFRAAFPDTLACALMPNHPHLVSLVVDVGAATRTFVGILGHLARRLRMPGRLWQPVPRADIISGRQKLRRAVRYVVLNPSRAGLVGDPLEWPWTTHRDAVGAVVGPWVPIATLGKRLGLWGTTKHKRELLHRYISADPDVVVSGTRLPTPAAPTAYASEPLETIARAACAATRAPPDAIARRTITRRLFVLLARDQGWTSSGLLADRCAITPRAIQHIAQNPAPHLLEPGRLCLGDPRLHSRTADLRNTGT